MDTESRYPYENPRLPADHRVGCRFFRRSSASSFCSALVSFVGVGLGHPVAQAGLADTQLLGQRGDRFVAQTGKLDGTQAGVVQAPEHPPW